MLADWVFDDVDRGYMQAALAEAEAAAARLEVPVGAIVVHHGEVISRAGNRRRELNDPTAHAEILAIRQAAQILGDWRLAGCALYVTLEPCPMCVATCRQARLELVVWGAEDPTAGACGSALDLAEDPRLGSILAHRGGLEAGTARSLLEDFFAKRRGKA
jgi:tRNA(Arg) A34 adenosine deaminase TadA